MSRDPRSFADLTLAAASLDRRSHLRGDPGLVAGLLRRPTTRVLELRGDRAIVDGDGDAMLLRLRTPEPADEERLAVYLGEEAGTAYVTVIAAPEEGDAVGHTLREVAVQLGDRDAGLFATSLALANWHRTHRFCPRCGTATEHARGGWLRTCPQDGSEHYPRTDPAVIMSVVDADDRLLLARGAGWPEGRYSVLAGFLEPGETLEAAVRREVREEVGIDVRDVTYLGDQPWPFPNSLMIGFTARAESTDLTLQEDEIAEACWVGRDELVERYRSGEWRVSGRLSISRRLVEHWYGGELPERR